MTGQITCWPSLFRPSDGRRVRAPALFERVKAPRAYASKGDVPRWSWATFKDNYRALANVIAVAGLGYDFDRGATREQIVEVFADFYGFGHTTWTAGRWRVGLVLSRCVTADEYDWVWRAGAALAERGGLEPDYAARDASRAWALPARHAGDAYQHAELTGAFFDVERALAEFPKPEPLPIYAASAGESDRLERASRYLATLPGAIAGSGGHAATFKAALVLVRGFELGADEALRLLVEQYNPRCAPPWSLWELKHKVKSAAMRARAAPGWLANKPLERRSA